MVLLLCAACLYSWTSALKAVCIWRPAERPAAAESPSRLLVPTDLFATSVKQEKAKDNMKCDLSTDCGSEISMMIFGANLFLAYIFLFPQNDNVAEDEE